MALVRDTETYRDGATGDMYYRSSTGLLLPVGGTRGSGNVITDQAGGVPLWAPQTGSSPAWVTNHPDTPPASPTLFSGVNYDIEFVRDVTLSGHTVLGSPSTTPSIVDRALRVVSGTSTSADFKGVEWACPGAAFTMTAKLRRKLVSVPFGVFGIGLRRNASGAGNFILDAGVTGTAHTATNFEIDKYTTVTARSSTGTAVNVGSGLLVPFYIRWVYDGTNITSYLSFTGHPDSFLQHFTETAATFLGGAPGRFLVGIDNFATTASVGYCEWIRFT